MGLRSIAQKYPEWSAPKITVISMHFYNTAWEYNTEWGTLTVQNEVGDKSEGT